MECLCGENESNLEHAMLLLISEWNLGLSPEQGIKRPGWKRELVHGAGGEEPRLIRPCMHVFLFLVVSYLSLQP